MMLGKLISLGTFLCLGGLGAAASEAAGAPIPDAVAQARAERLVEDVYGDRIRAADSPQKKAALARDILQTATKDPDEANKYAGLQTAKRLALEAEDGKLGLEAVRQIMASFEGPGEDDPAELLRQAELLWETAEQEKGAEKLARRLDAAEVWLRTGIDSALLKEKWGQRLKEIEATSAETVLHARDAKVVATRAAYSKKHDAICFWRNPQEYVQWVVRLTPGTYGVSLEYAGSGAGPGSLFAVSLSRPQAPRALATAQFTLQSTGNWNQYVAAPIGRLVIRDEGDYILRLYVVRKIHDKPKLPLINVRSVRLLAF